MGHTIGPRAIMGKKIPLKATYVVLNEEAPPELYEKALRAYAASAIRAYVKSQRIPPKKGPAALREQETSLDEDW
jgi:hypothetical protein